MILLRTSRIVFLLLLSKFWQIQRPPRVIPEGGFDTMVMTNIVFSWLLLEFNSLFLGVTWRVEFPDGSKLG